VFSGWLGVYLDTSGTHKVDWGEVAAIVEDAYRHVAPKTLIDELDNTSSPATPELPVRCSQSEYRWAYRMFTRSPR